MSGRRLRGTSGSVRSLLSRRLKGLRSASEESHWVTLLSWQIPMKERQDRPVWCGAGDRRAVKVLSRCHVRIAHVSALETWNSAWSTHRPHVIDGAIHRQVETRPRCFTAWLPSCRNSSHELRHSSFLIQMLCVTERPHQLITGTRCRR
jgi:hypothetical protein